MSKITFNRTQVIIDYETLYEDTFGSITDKDNHLEEITNLLHGIESYDDVYNAEDPADGSEPKISLGQRNALIAALKRTATEKEDQANANLIASAPELLEELKRLNKWFTEHLYVSGKPNTENLEYLIAKAEGK